MADGLAGRNAQLRAIFGVGLLEVAQFVLPSSPYARRPLLIRTSGVMARVAWSTLHRFVGSEHRPTLVHLSSPLSTIHPGDNARAATAASDGLGALSDACFKDPLSGALPCGESCARGPQP